MAPVVTVCLLGILVFAPFAFTQGVPTSNPQAVAYASQSTSALTGGVAIIDVTLAGNATWTAGSGIETGTATLSAKGLTESRIDLALSDGNRSEIRNSLAGYPAGAWVGKDGIPHAYADHNCWTDANWFFPALSMLSGSDPSVVLSYVGPAKRFGIAVQHLRAYRINNTFPQSKQLSTMDFYLDQTSLLPVSLAFTVHPDGDPMVNIPLEVRFTSYQSSNGLQYPGHIQEYLQGTLLLDLQVTGVAINTGLQDGVFTIQ